jgi:hypothetical protein
MQTQPKSDEAKTGRGKRARQAARTAEDAFSGGEDLTRRPLGLKSPWLAGTSRLWEAQRDTGGEE